MIRLSGWRIRTSRRRFNSKSVWLSSNKLPLERTRSRYVYSGSCFRWNADLIFPLPPNLYYPLKSILFVQLGFISIDSLQRRKLQRTRRKQSRHYWTRRGWKLSCSRLLSRFRKYLLERVGLITRYSGDNWHIDPKTVRRIEGKSDRMLIHRYFVYTSRMGIVRRVSYNPPAPEDQLTIRKQV